MKILSKLKTPVLGLAILGSIAVAPLDPQAMPLVTSFCDVASHFTDNPVITNASSTATSQRYAYHPSTFTDTDGNGIICASIFLKSNGTPEVVQTPDTTYRSMGEKEGQKFNPTKAEFKSLVSVFTQTANAAIAFDATGTAPALTATSQTWAHIVTGSNPVLFVYGKVRSTTATNLQLMKYNGVQMATTTTVTSYNDSQIGWMMQLANPTTGTHNVVATFDSSLNTVFWSASYSGAAQTGIPDSSATSGGGTSSNNFSMSTTVVAANSWLLMGSVGLDAAVCTGTTGQGAIRGIPTNGPQIEDSNGTVGTGSQSISVTGCGLRVENKIIISIAPFISASTVLSNPIILQDE